MKGINFNQKPTPVARESSRATCENSTERMWRLVVTVSVSSGFSSLMRSESVIFLCPLQSLFHVLSSGVNHNATARRRHFPSPSLAGNQTWVSSTTRGLRLAFGGQPLLPHPMSREQGWGHLRANPVFGVLWFIPPLLVVAYLPPASFIRRIFSGLFVVVLAWVQCGVDDGTHRLEGVRTENSSGHILVGKHLHSSYSRTDVV